MRLVHYYREATRPSGVTAAIAAWQRVAIRLGIDTVVVHSGGGGGKEWQPGGKAVRHVGSGRQFALPVEFGWLSGADVVVLHEGWMTSNYVAALVSRLRRVPYVVITHGVYEPGVMRGLHFRRLRQWAEARYLTSASVVHVFFKGEAELVRRVAPRASCQVVPMGFEPEWPAQTNDAGGYIAWFGRYDPDHKGLDRLLFALALLPAERRPRLALRGEDYKGGRSEVQRLVVDLNLEGDVEVRGPVYSDEKRAFLCGAAAFVFPSRWEAFGIALIEAMAAGLPVLVSDAAQIAPLVKAKNAGMVVSFDEPIVAARALEEIRSHQELGVRARRFVDEDLDWSASAKAYEELISGIVRVRSHR